MHTNARRHRLTLALTLLGVVVATIGAILPWLVVPVAAPERPVALDVDFADAGTLYAVGLLALVCLIAAATLLTGRANVAARCAGVAIAAALFAHLLSLARTVRAPLFQVALLGHDHVAPLAVNAGKGLYLAAGAVVALGAAAWFAPGTLSDRPTGPAPAEAGDNDPSLIPR